MPRPKNQKGIIPILILIAVGIFVLVGGVLVVCNQFVKTGKSGKTALEPSSELAPQTFTYQPQDQTTNEPGYTIKTTSRME